MSEATGRDSSQLQDREPEWKLADLSHAACSDEQPGLEPYSRVECQ
jgi:hypothetical protein